MRVSRRVQIERRNLLVIDDFISPAESERTFSDLQDLPFKRKEADSPKSLHVKNWAFDSRVEPFFIDRVRRLVERYFGAGNWQTERVYCNSAQFGDMLFAHRDCGRKDDSVTALLYANLEWHRDWGGETLFFDDDGDTACAVLPRPRRLALFDGGIEHRASAPQRDCYASRLTLAMKFERRGPKRRKRR